MVLFTSVEKLLLKIFLIFVVSFFLLTDMILNLEFFFPLFISLFKSIFFNFDLLLGNPLLFFFEAYSSRLILFDLFVFFLEVSFFTFINILLFLTILLLILSIFGIE